MAPSQRWNTADPNMPVNKSAQSRVGILVGSRLPPNEENVLLSWGKMLGDQFDLDIIVDSADDRIPKHLEQYYTIRDYSRSTVFLRKLPLLKEVIISGWMLRKYVKDVKPGVILHITKPQTYGFAVALIGKRFAIPFVVRNGGDILNAYKRTPGFLRKCYIWIRVTLFAYVAFRLAPSIITIGARLKGVLIRNGIDEKKIHIIPQPIDRERFSPPADKSLYMKALGVPLDKAMVLYVGRMSKLERLGIVPSIIERVLARDSGFVFFFVGKVSSYAEELRKAGGESVTLAGEIPHEEIPKFYKAAALLIHISGSEGSIPNSVLEALACGLPVCANRVGEVESVTANVFDTAEEFSEFIVKRDWTRDPVPEEFEWNSLRQRYVECLREVLES